MPPSKRTGVALGVVAALLWSPHFYAVTQQLSESSAPNPLVMHFHIVFWAAVASLAILFITGRSGELSVFNRNEGRFLFLVLTGGYGFWVLRALAIERAGSNLAHVHILFYTAPLLLGFMSIVTRDAAPASQIGKLLLGFVGCILIAWQPGAEGMPDIAGSLLALGAAACWAAFALAARPLLKQEKVLPTLAIVLGMGAVCMLATCLSTGANIIIPSEELWPTMWLGLVTGTLAFGCWLKYLSSTPAPLAAPLWYLALVFGIAWAHWIAEQPLTWLTFGGAVLILFFVAHGTSTGRRRPAATMGDVIRG